MTVTLLLALAAFVAVVANSIGKAPLWVAVMLLMLIELIEQIPLGTK